ncbi:glycosyltransferase family 4 protein [Methylobacterium sp. WL9]|uniref:glycosyltransferase family 4 protein n=2 Tax=Methylobacterium TaxID=407 RepID=UPI00164F3676|nr:glycosyltransferase family 4 protein [Methylobacterium sp. WL9]
MLLITARYAHHGAHSGLEPLHAILEQNFAVDVAKPSRTAKAALALDRFSHLIPRLMGQPPQQAGWSPYYTPSASLVEGAAIRQARQKRYDVVFCESIEKFHDRLGLIKQAHPGCRLVGMVHQPPSWWRLNAISAGVLDDFDAVIALSRQSRDHVERELGVRSVAFVNHGVDVTYFRPPEADRAIQDGFDICVVGDWLRDFDLVAQTIERTSAETPSFRWHLVLPTAARTTDAHYRAARYNNVRWYSNISDEALLALYHRCHAMFLPLIDATANNAMMEALSCALPIIVSDVGGVRDYAGEYVDYVGTRDPADVIASLRACVADYPAKRLRAAAGREHARTHLAWTKVGLQMAAIAKSL